MYNFKKIHVNFKKIILYCYTFFCTKIIWILFQMLTVAIVPQYICSSDVSYSDYSEETNKAFNVTVGAKEIRNTTIHSGHFQPNTTNIFISLANYFKNTLTQFLIYQIIEYLVYKVFNRIFRIFKQYSEVRFTQPPPSSNY